MPMVIDFWISDSKHTVLRRFGGHAVAKLPFEPFSLLAKLAHRGITSPSANDCSVVRFNICCWTPCLT